MPPNVMISMIPSHNRVASVPSCSPAVICTITVVNNNLHPWDDNRINSWVQPTEMSSMTGIQTWLVEHPKAGQKCGRSEIVPTVTMGGETQLPNSKMDSCSSRKLLRYTWKQYLYEPDFSVDILGTCLMKSQQNKASEDQRNIPCILHHHAVIGSTVLGSISCCVRSSIQNKDS